MKNEEKMKENLIMTLENETNVLFEKIKKGNSKRFALIKRIDFEKTANSTLHLFVKDVLQELEAYKKTFTEHNISSETIIVNRLNYLVENEK